MPRRRSPTARRRPATVMSSLRATGSDWLTLPVSDWNSVTLSGRAQLARQEGPAFESRWGATIAMFAHRAPGVQPWTVRRGPRVPVRSAALTKARQAG